MLPQRPATPSSAVTELAFLKRSPKSSFSSAIANNDESESYDAARLTSSNQYESFVDAGQLLVGDDRSSTASGSDSGEDSIERRSIVDSLFDRRDNSAEVDQVEPTSSNEPLSDNSLAISAARDHWVKNGQESGRRIQALLKSQPEISTIENDSYNVGEFEQESSALEVGASKDESMSCASQDSRSVGLHEGDVNPESQELPFAGPEGPSYDSPPMVAVSPEGLAPDCQGDDNVLETPTNNCKIESDFVDVDLADLGSHIGDDSDRLSVDGLKKTSHDVKDISSDNQSTDAVSEATVTRLDKVMQSSCIQASDAVSQKENCNSGVKGDASLDNRSIGSTTDHCSALAQARGVDQVRSGNPVGSSGDSAGSSGNRACSSDNLANPSCDLAGSSDNMVDFSAKQAPSPLAMILEPVSPPDSDDLAPSSAFKQNSVSCTTTVMNGFADDASTIAVNASMDYAEFPDKKSRVPFIRAHSLDDDGAKNLNKSLDSSVANEDLLQKFVNSTETTIRQVGSPREDGRSGNNASLSHASSVKPVAAWKSLGDHDNEMRIRRQMAVIADHSRPSDIRAASERHGQSVATRAAVSLSGKTDGVVALNNDETVETGCITENNESTEGQALARRHLAPAAVDKHQTKCTVNNLDSVVDRKSDNDACPQVVDLLVRGSERGLSQQSLPSTIDSQLNFSKNSDSATELSESELFVHDNASHAEFNDPFSDIPDADGGGILHRNDSHDVARKTYCKELMKVKLEVNRIDEHSGSALFNSTGAEETIGRKIVSTPDDSTATGSEAVDLNDSVSTISAMEDGGEAGAFATGWGPPTIFFFIFY